MLTDEHAIDLQEVDLAVRESKALFDHAKDMRDREIRRVAAEGGTYRDIARASGVAYQRVAQIVTGHAPPTRDRGDELEHACPRCDAGIGEQCIYNGKPDFQRMHLVRSQLAYAAFAERHPEVGH